MTDVYGEFHTVFEVEDKAYELKPDGNSEFVPDREEPEFKVLQQTKLLYKKTHTGIIRVWEGRVIQKAGGGVFLETRSGQKGGVIAARSRLIGPTKTMDSVDNALSKLSSHMKTKMLGGYFETEEAANKYVRTKPMLLHKWDTNSKKIYYPAFIQPKLDGVCALYRDDKDRPRFESRDNNEFVKMRPKALEIAEYFDRIAGKDRVRMNLHCELYAHGYHVSEIVEALKGDRDDILSEIKPFVFDYIPQVSIFDELPYDRRLRDGALYSKWDNPDLPFVPIKTLVAQSHDHVDEHFKSFLRQGYEGAVICNSGGLYRYDTRSYDKLKKKQLDSAEFRIIDTEYEMNGETKLIIFVLETKDGIRFKARPAWNHKVRATAWEKSESYIGKPGTVQYRGLTKYGTPFHPVFISVRDYE